MTQELPLISAPDAILRIKKMIENNQGDAGRLRYISERLQNGKMLFNSDKSYLSRKISANVIPIQLRKPTEHDEKIKQTKRLLALNFGEPGRLRHILQCLEKNKHLYHSDDHYLETKIQQFHDYYEGKRLKKGVRAIISNPQTYEEIYQEPPRNEKNIAIPDQNIPEKLQGIEDAVLYQEPKKTSDLFDLIEDVPEKDLEIQQEREKIGKLKHNHEQIKIQHDELSQLIAYRQEYEQKINHEKEILEKEIKVEQEKVKEKDELVAQLIKNQSRLLQSKTEREVILEQIKIDKEKSEKELTEMSKELKELKDEYERIQKEIRTRKENLEKQINEQKKRNEKLKEDREEE